MLSGVVKMSFSAFRSRRPGPLLKCHETVRGQVAVRDKKSKKSEGKWEQHQTVRKKCTPVRVEPEIDIHWMLSRQEQQLNNVHTETPQPYAPTS
jgi:hypothetical protein